MTLYIWTTFCIISFDFPVRNSSFSSNPIIYFYYLFCIFHTDFCSVSSTSSMFPLAIVRHCSPVLPLQRLLPPPSAYSPKRHIWLSVCQGKGHSHWQNIQKTKTKKDEEKNRAISEMAKKMKVAVKDEKEGESRFDPAANRKLQDVMTVGAGGGQQGNWRDIKAALV